MQLRLHVDLVGRLLLQFIFGTFPCFDIFGSLSDDFYLPKW